MTDSHIKWTFSHFNDLSCDELYNLLAARVQVFIVEQNCPFQDLDGVDKSSWHLLGYANSELVAYARIIPAKVTFDEASIGRIITTEAGRGKGYGLALMQESISQLEKLFGPVPIRIGAQMYLIKFYQKFGFEVVSEPYDEDGIMHVEMLRSV